ncbi:MAG: NAD(P)H-quinone oxidoreductase, partial [Limnobacter sp.]|nr:NAD(P)H-quinone oxidoreductase [Limnobacter sp.]
MDLPGAMRAVGLQEPGGVEQLFIEEVSLPSVGPCEVLVKVAACGVNRPDVLQRAGLYPPPKDANPRLGLEISGHIVAMGEQVDASALNQPVMALCNGGGYAEFATVPFSQCMTVPAGLSLTEAASLPETYMTVWQNVFMTGRLEPGQHLLVHGGSSGIGTAAIQLAVAHGATVHATVGNGEKAEYCKQLGAEFVYNYREQDWAELALANSEGGVNLVLDMVAGSYLNRDLHCLAPQGQVIVIA